MHTSRTRTRAGRLALVFTTMAAFMVPAAAANAVEITPLGGCGGSYSPRVGGGEAHWDLTCSGGEITITGWVKDTAADGKCARVTAHFSNGDVSAWKACPEGTTTRFSETHDGALVDAYLTVT